MSDKKKKLILDRHISRRQFLTEAGGAFLSLPPLLSLMPEKVLAQAVANRRKRVITYISRFGIDGHHFWPNQQNDMTAVPGEFSVFQKKLSDIPGQISRLVDSDFVSIYPHMNMLMGLSLCGGNYAGHNRTVLSGTHSGEESPRFGKSIDVIMEQSPGVYKQGETIANKAVRLFSNDHDNDFSYDRVNGKRIVSDGLQGDKNLFNTLFANLMPPTENPPATQSKKQLVVDRVYDDLKNLESNPRISAADKEVLDRYISGIYDLQLKVQANNPPSCQKPDLQLQAKNQGNFYGLPQTGWGIQDVGKMFDNYNEMIALAFACDLTRVVHIGNLLWTDAVVGINHDYRLHHNATGGSTGAADRQKWGLKKMLSLAKKLSAFPDPFGGGSLLDNSLILYTNELGDWTTGHLTLKMPAITFGSLGGTFKTGYFVDYHQKPLRGIPYLNGTDFGRPFKQLLQAIMSGMGVPKSEYMQIGDGNGFGEFKQGINQFGKVIPDAFAAYATTHNDPLPFIYQGPQT